MINTSQSTCLPGYSVQILAQARKSSYQPLKPWRGISSSGWKVASTQQGFTPSQSSHGLEQVSSLGYLVRNSSLKWLPRRIAGGPVCIPISLGQVQTPGYQSVAWHFNFLSSPFWHYLGPYFQMKWASIWWLNQMQRRWWAPYRESLSEEAACMRKVWQAKKKC